MARTLMYTHFILFKSLLETPKIHYHCQHKHCCGVPEIEGGVSGFYTHEGKIVEGVFMLK
jgi:hypothetical protein